MRKNIISILIISILSTGISYYFISGLPQFTFYLIYKSFKAHDVESFYKYVDVDSIIDNLINDALEESMQEKQANDEWGALGIGLAQAIKPMAKNILTNLAKQEITNAIEDIKQPLNKETPVEETPVKSFVNRFKSLKELSNIKIRRSGKVAEVEIPSAKINESLTVKMRRMPQRYWKIVAINIPYRPNDIKSNIKEKTTQQVSDDFNNNPHYQEYYKYVRNRIGKVAYNGYNRKEVGEVYLFFTVQKNGEVNDIRVLEGKSSSSPYLRQIATQAVKAASPFPIFPVDLEYPQLNFNIVLSYETE